MIYFKRVFYIATIIIASAASITLQAQTVKEITYPSALRKSGNLLNVAAVQGDEILCRKDEMTFVFVDEDFKPIRTITNSNLRGTGVGSGVYFLKGAAYASKFIKKKDGGNGINAANCVKLDKSNSPVLDLMSETSKLTMVDAPTKKIRLSPAEMQQLLNTGTVPSSVASGMAMPASIPTISPNGERMLNVLTKSDEKKTSLILHWYDEKLKFKQDKECDLTGLLGGKKWYLGAQRTGLFDINMYPKKLIFTDNGLICLPGWLGEDKAEKNVLALPALFIYDELTDKHSLVKQTNFGAEYDRVITNYSEEQGLIYTVGVKPFDKGKEKFSAELQSEKFVAVDIIDPKTSKVVGTSKFGFTTNQLKELETNPKGGTRNKFDFTELTSFTSHVLSNGNMVILMEYDQTAVRQEVDKWVVIPNNQELIYFIVDSKGALITDGIIEKNQTKVKNYEHGSFKSIAIGNSVHIVFNSLGHMDRNDIMVATIDESGVSSVKELITSKVALFSSTAIGQGIQQAKFLSIFNSNTLAKNNSLYFCTSTTGSTAGLKIAKVSFK